jgi:hypothetical protein
MGTSEGARKAWEMRKRSERSYRRYLTYTAVVPHAAHYTRREMASELRAVRSSGPAFRGPGGSVHAVYEVTRRSGSPAFTNVKGAVNATQGLRGVVRAARVPTWAGKPRKTPRVQKARG